MTFCQSRPPLRVTCTRPSSRLPRDTFGPRKRSLILLLGRHAPRLAQRDISFRLKIHHSCGIRPKVSDIRCCLHVGRAPRKHRDRAGSLLLRRAESRCESGRGCLPWSRGARRTMAWSPTMCSNGTSGSPGATWSDRCRGHGRARHPERTVAAHWRRSVHSGFGRAGAHGRPRERRVHTTVHPGDRFPLGEASARSRAVPAIVSRHHTGAS